MPQDTIVIIDGTFADVDGSLSLYADAVFEASFSPSADYGKIIYLYMDGKRYMQTGDVKQDFCDELYQDIVDAVCEAFDCPEAAAVRAQDSVSNIKCWHADYTVNYNDEYRAYRRNHSAIAQWWKPVWDTFICEQNSFVGGITA